MTVTDDLRTLDLAAVRRNVDQAHRLAATGPRSRGADEVAVALTRDLRILLVGFRAAVDQMQLEGRAREVAENTSRHARDILMTSHQFPNGAARLRLLAGACRLLASYADRALHEGSQRR